MILCLHMNAESVGQGQNFDIGDTLVYVPRVDHHI